MRVRNMVLLLLAVGTILLAGCGAQTATKEHSGNFHIVTSFYPMYIDAINITRGVDGVTVTNMTKPQTGCLHDYQLQNSDMQELTQADVFVINGAGMESFLNRVTTQLPNLPVITASEGIPLLEEDHDHGDDHDHEEDHEEGEEEGNPHVWVSIHGAQEEVETITRGLMELDPEHAREYRQNADGYLEKLRALETEMHEALDPYVGTSIVTFHEAFPYFAQEFGLNIRAVVNREPESQPSAREIAGTIDLIRESRVKAVFAEPQYNTDTAWLISQESGVPFYLLDPCTSGAMEKDAYLTAMRENMRILQAAFGGEEP